MPNFNILNFLFREIGFYGKFVNQKTFADIYHDLCDALDTINSLLTPHLIPTTLMMLMMDIFLCYTIVLDIFADNTWSYISMFLNAYYLLTHFAVITLISFAGSSTTKMATKIGFHFNRTVIDDMSAKPASNIIQVQLQSRKLIIKNAFFDINWNILATVSIIIHGTNT